MKFSIKAFIAGVILSVLFVSVKNIYSCELSAQADKGVYRALKIGRLDNLYIGSSMFRKGITLYDDKSESFLIYYNGLDPVNEAVILEYLFGNGLRVKNLYVDMFASTAAKDSWLYDMRLMFDSPLELKLSLCNLALKNPEAEYFSALWEMLVNAENDMFILWPLYNRLTAKRYYRGGYSADTFNRGLTHDAMALVSPPKSDSVKMNHAQKEAIIRIIELCRKYNVNLIFAETPKYNGLEIDGGYIAITGEYFGLLRDYGVKCIISRRTLDNIKASAGENVYTYDFPYEEPSMFEDYIHLSTEGSRNFMSVLRDIQKVNDM